MSTEPESVAVESGASSAGAMDATRDGGATGAARPWGAAKKAAFRFCFVYFILYSLSNQILGGLLLIPKVDIPDPGSKWPLRPMTFWVAKHVFRVTHELVYTGSGSGDKTFDWVMTFCLLMIAAAGTLVWSMLDRRREDYARMYKWFRVFVRFVLASEMFLYGFDKLIPLQMPFPFLTRLLEPFGNFSPMGVLWYSIGASRSYEIFAGCAEALGGALLLAPRTATLGAVVCLADLIQVFVLNMTYDVPVKLFSFHLILFSVFLLAPDLGRLADFFLRARPAAASAEPKLFATARANRIAVLVQVLFGAYLMGVNVYQGSQSWHEYGGGRTKSALYGIWDVQQMSIDGKDHLALLDDKDRWRRLVFDFEKGVSLQHMDETFTGYGAAIDEKAKSLELSKPSDKKWKAEFKFERPTADSLVVDGTMDGHQIYSQLKLFDRNQFTLVNRGFHWINEYPFQR